jgi:hypothetical protein
MVGLAVDNSCCSQLVESVPRTGGVVGVVVVVVLGVVVVVLLW